MPEGLKKTIWFSIVFRIVFPVLISILLFAFAIFFIILPWFEHYLMESRQLLIREQVNTVWGLLDDYNDRVEAGEITLDQAKNRAEERLRSLRYGIDNKDYFWIFDLNDSTLQMHPYIPEYQGKDFTTIQDPKGRFLFAEMGKVISDDEAGYVEYVWQWKDDPARIEPKLSYVRLFAPWNWALGTGVYINDVHDEIDLISKKVNAFVAVVLSLIVMVSLFLIAQAFKTERLRFKAVSDLDDQKELMTNIVESMSEGILVLDRNFHFKYWNKAMEQISERTREDLIASNLKIWEAFPHLVTHGVDMLMKQAMDGQKGHTDETPYELASGKMGYTSETYLPLKTSSGETKGIVGVIHDITEQKKAQEAIRLSEMNYQEIFNSTNDAIFVHDPKAGQIVDANRSALEMFGYTRDEAVNLFVSDLGSGVEPFTDSLIKEKWQLVIEEGPQLFEWLNKKKSGELFWGEINLRFASIAGQDRILSVVRDVSDRKKAQQEILESRTVLESTIESTIEGVLVVNDDWSVSHYNTEFLKIWSIPEELAQQRENQALVDYVLPMLEEPQRFQDLFKGLYRTSRKSEDIFKFKNGMIVEVRSAPLVIENQESGRVWFVRDITERKLAEEKKLEYIRFLENIDKIDSIVRQSTDIDLVLSDILNENLSIFDCDRAWLFYPGDSESDFWRIPKLASKPEFAPSIPINIDISMTPEFRRIIEEVMCSKEPLCYGDDSGREMPDLAEYDHAKSMIVMPLYPKTGKPWILGLHQCSYSRSWNPEEVSTFKEIARRITDALTILLILNDLRESRFKLRSLINAMPDIVCFKDGQGRWIIANDFDLNLFNLKGVEYEGKTDAELAQYSEFYHDAFLACEASDEIAWNHGKLYRTDEEIPNPDGTNYTFDVIKLPFFDEDGKRKGLLVVGRDITEKKRVEIDREKLLKTLSQKNEELSSIVFAASHDLRSPLVNISGFSFELADNCKKMLSILTPESLSDEKYNEVQEILEKEIPDSLDFIRAGVDKIYVLLKGLLKLSRLGREVFDVKQLDVNEIVDEVVLAMHYQIAASGSKVDVDELPKCYADDAKLNQVLTNLIDNAIKYRKPDCPCQITIKGWTEDDMSIYSVQDNGIGMDPAHIDTVFQIFHRLNPEDEVSGEGLGLTIVRRIVIRLNGRVWVESEKGKGSTFYIALPRTRQSIV